MNFIQVLYVPTRGCVTRARDLFLYQKRGNTKKKEKKDKGEKLTSTKWFDGDPTFFLLASE